MAKHRGKEAVMNKTNTQDTTQLIAPERASTLKGSGNRIDKTTTRQSK